ncbi:TPA: DNA-directed RNA polymerase subunit alpha [Patescibacteria group bacterium]|nr:MAG: DNA-directed RNA polymerase subunit alpha [Parcubacteria group bacterium GW2011_GWD2_42_14]HCC05310.1 DNA-directed RNA polymerase subunit alpha [Patescibacteria group bacterium]
MDNNVALPSKPRVVSEKENSASFEIDGLFPGYGHTLGNSLRRIILSSLTGAAITSVKIDDVPHEFSTIDGVQEDVITILLNLKRVRFSMVGNEPQVLTLSAKGVHEVTAKDIKTTGQVEILNPDQHIAELTTKNASLSMEITVEKGLGYVPRELRDEDKAEIGTIQLDATFTPIRRVNYEVENMRVGDRTDYNRLRIFIETDGAITPRQALERSIEIMIHQLKAIVGFKESREEEVEEPAVDTSPKSDMSSAPKQKEQVDTEVLKTRIESLKLSARTISALDQANIRTVGGLARKREEDVLAIEGLGIKGLQEIKRALSEFGITLR